MTHRAISVSPLTRRTVLSLVIALLWLPRSSASQTTPAPDVPWGINNAFASSGASTSGWLGDLGATSISDHLPRRKIEKQKAKKVAYDFGPIEDKLRVYADEAGANAWFVINVESVYQFKDGRLVNSGPAAGTYVPDGPSSYLAYKDFLKALVTYVNSRSPGWKVRYWSIDNEHSNLQLLAFCSEAIDGPCAKQAGREYARLLEVSHDVIKGLDPNAKIVFGGPGSICPDAVYEAYYNEALFFLKQHRADGRFDFFDYHNFNTYQLYRENVRGKTVEFYRQLLANNGFAGKPILIKAGATHSGMDKLAGGLKGLDEHQTEAQQAEYLIKRAVYHVGKDVKRVLWGTIREDTEIHGTFSHNGLIYNGIPTADACDPAAELPCPDPGDGIKKLSYYTFKKLVEKLRDSDWEGIETVSEGADHVYIYKFTKTDSGAAVNVAWWDYFEDVGESRSVTINVGDAPQVTVTELIPPFESGADITEYASAFRAETKAVENHEVTLQLGASPVLVE
ncbi:MAG TPA: hypothetical protein VLF14_07120 [Candidatus Binatia bacterium]|nr:hypothetical protein [Candidatus Binatia bacterium]